MWMTYHVRKLDICIPLEAFGKFKVVACQSVQYNHLDLLGGEKAARTRMAPVAKRQAVLADTHELIHCSLSGRAFFLEFLPRSIIPQSIKPVRAFKFVRVKAHSNGRYFD